MAGHKLTKAETDARIAQCYKMRYETTPPTKHADYIIWCKKNYGNKSEMQYTAYWMKAGDIYKAAWKQKLEDSVGLATDEMVKLLQDEDPRVRQRAIDQIYKFSGNETEKLEIVGSVELTWGGTSDE